MIRTFIFRVFIALSIAVAAGSATRAGDAVPEADQVEIAAKARYRGEVIFLRGGFDVFSRGLDDMAKKLEERGVKTSVLSHRQSEKAYQQILANRKKYGRNPIVLVGHSWGANAAIDIATRLRKRNVRVNYVATFAATNPPPVPSNVRKLTNYYFKTDGWGKPVTKAKGARGNVKNIDLSATPGINHFNIEKSPRLQRQVIRNVLRFVRRSGRA